MLSVLLILFSSRRYSSQLCLCASANLPGHPVFRSANEKRKNGRARPKKLAFTRVDAVCAGEEASYTGKEKLCGRVWRNFKTEGLPSLCHN